jgi:hypothetical protein
LLQVKLVYAIDIYTHIKSFGDKNIKVISYENDEKSLTNDLSKYTRVPPPQPNWKVKDPARSTYNQLYGIMKCNELKKVYEESNNMKFDWVIRSRFDFAINAKLFSHRFF